MTGFNLAGVFQDEDHLLAAVRAAREEGLKIVDVYSPYAVHGLERALGLKRSRLAWVCLVFGALGALLKLWFEIWTAAVDWPVIVGGKPFNSLPAFVPITFEVMVLFAGLSTVGAFFVVSRLYPGKQTGLVDPGVTNDRFVLVLAETDSTFDVSRVRSLLQRHGAIDVREQLTEEAYVCPQK